MKKMSLLFLVVIAQMQSSFGSGGVSGGGGGTIHPSSVDLRRIEEVVQEYAGKLLISFFERAKFEYLQNEEKSSPFKVVFESKTPIVDLIRHSRIEVRKNGPCFDAEGKPWDGSIYAEASYAICLSAATMAPKLTAYHVEAETLALAAHEYAHLAGATEVEAVQIQQVALDTFSTIQFGEVRSHIILDLNPLFADTVFGSDRQYHANELYRLQRFLDAKVDQLDSDTLVAIGERMHLIANRLTYARNQRLSFAEATDLALLGPSLELMTTGLLYLASVDPAETPETRAAYAAKIDGIFGDRKEITALDFAAAVTEERHCRLQPTLCFSKEYSQMNIRKPKSVSDARELLLSYDRLFRRIRSFVKDLASCDAFNAGADRTNCGMPLPGDVI